VASRRVKIREGKLMDLLFGPILLVGGGGAFFFLLLFFLFLFPVGGVRGGANGA